MNIKTWFYVGFLVVGLEFCGSSDYGKTYAATGKSWEKMNEAL